MSDPCEKWNDTLSDKGVTTKNTEKDISLECIDKTWKDVGCITKPTRYYDETTKKTPIFVQKLTLDLLTKDMSNWASGDNTVDTKICYGGCMDWIKDKSKTNLSNECVNYLWENETSCEAEPTHFYDKDDVLKKEYKKLNFEKFRKKIKQIGAKGNYTDEYKCDGQYSSNTIIIFVIVFIVLITVVKKFILPSPPPMDYY